MSTGRRSKRLRGRNYALGAQLDTFLVCAASGVVINRLFLIVTGYPQIGGRNPDAIHISHAIYGPFAMMVAVALAIAFLNPAMRWILAIVGGLGFGWFVDELGKFVSNAGYLYRPALALIYITFVLMFLGFRALAGHRFGPDDAVANALESLKSAALGALDDAQRAQALARFDAAAPAGDFSAQVRDLLGNAPASSARSPGVWSRFRTRVRARYVAWSHRRSFTAVIVTFFVLLAISTLGSVVGLSVDGAGITKPSERVATAAATIAGILVLIGIWQIRKSRLAALRWFDRALLVWILVVQVYLFHQEQFAAIVGLAVDLVIWVMVRSAIAVEEQRARDRQRRRTRRARSTQRYPSGMTTGFSAPRTTIVVLQRECFTPTAERLEPILATAGSPARVIFVDGGSPASCREWLDAAAARLDITVLRTPHFLAPGEGRALALPFVDTEYVAFVDNDVQMSRGWLAALEHAADTTGAWLVGPLYLHGAPSGSFEAPRIHMAGGTCAIETTAGRRRVTTSMHRYDEPVSDGVPTERFATHLLEFHCVLARTEVMKRDGMHDPELRTGHDMMDLCLRVGAAGGECWVEPGAWVFYERPSRIARDDRDLFALRWSVAWDDLTLERFATSWGLDADDPKSIDTRHWHSYHRRLEYLPANTIIQRVQRKRRYLADSVVQATALAHDAALRRQGGMTVTHAASWLATSPDATATY